jgi:lysophospholipase L1-like esterase
LVIFAACGPTPGVATGQGQQPALTAQSQATPAVQSVYVAIGASDAFGIGTQNPATQAWPVVLARALGVSYRLVDLGIPGATVELATRDELPIALDSQPRIITVWLAVNDFDVGVPLATYAAQLRTLLDDLERETSARVYVANMPDLTYIPYFAQRDPQQLESQIAAWNTAIAQDCTAAGATLVDLYVDWAELASHPEYISSDGFHPSAAGAARLAAIFASVIQPGAATAPVAASQQPEAGTP